MSVTHVLIDDEKNRVLEANEDEIIIDIAQMAYSIEGFQVHKETWVIPEKEEQH